MAARGAIRMEETTRRPGETAHKYMRKHTLHTLSHLGPIPSLPLTPSPYPFKTRGRGKGKG